MSTCMILKQSLLMLGGLLGGAAIEFDDDEVALKDLPAKVTSAVKAKFPEAEMKKAFKEEEDGKTVYEVESMLAGKSLDLVVSPEGVLMEVEKEVDPKGLAKPILEAVAAKYPGSTVEDAEEVETLKDGKLVKTFELEVVDKDKEEWEVVVSPEGKILKATESEDEDDDDKDEDDK